MYVKTHIISGLLFSVVLVAIFPKIGLLGAGIIFLSSFLIDIDHYAYFVLKEKDLSLKRAYEWHITARKKLICLPRKVRNRVYLRPCVLHGVELLFFLIIMGFLVSKYFLFIFIGSAFHLILDIPYQFRDWDRADKISAVYDLWKYRKLKSIEEVISSASYKTS